MIYKIPSSINRCVCKEKGSGLKIGLLARAPEVPLSRVHSVCACVGGCISISGALIGGKLVTLPHIRGGGNMSRQKPPLCCRLVYGADFSKTTKN